MSSDTMQSVLYEVREGTTPGGVLNQPEDGQERSPGACGS